MYWALKEVENEGEGVEEHDIVKNHMECVLADATHWIAVVVVVVVEVVYAPEEEIPLLP